MRLCSRSLGLVATLLAGCGAPSALIARDDREFHTAAGRWSRTRALVEQQAPAAPEAPLFMMAEGFYRYRLEFPKRSFGVYVAQAAAVAIELPALQAVAGSLDLFQLRLKTTDGAVQIWETMLAWYPRTPLRPLALYRLGWAYRNSSAAGLPRESGNQAFDALIAESPHSSLAKLAAAARSVPWKSTEAATGWSVVPGLGQMYVGEHLNGGVRLAAALVAVAMIVTPAVIAYRRRDELTWRGDWPLLATGIGGIVFLSVNYTLAYEDAIRGVVQWNEREEARFEARYPDAP